MAYTPTNKALEDMMSEFDYTYAERQRVVGVGNAAGDSTYIGFYIENPIEDLEVTIADEDTEAIAVTTQVVDPGGDAIAERVVLRMMLFDSADYDALLGAKMASVAVTITTDKGMLVEEVGEDFDMIFLTNDSGELDLVFTDTGAGSEEAWLGFILPNGKFVEGGHVAFAAV